MWEQRKAVSAVNSAGSRQLGKREQGEGQVRSPWNSHVQLEVRDAEQRGELVKWTDIVLVGWKGQPGDVHGVTLYKAEISPVGHIIKEIQMDNIIRVGPNLPNSPLNSNPVELGEGSLHKGRFKLLLISTDMHKLLFLNGWIFFQSSWFLSKYLYLPECPWFFLDKKDFMWG